MKLLRTLFSVVALAATTASAAITEKDWCTIETPDSWAPGTPLVVKVTPKIDGPDGAQLGCHLHWMKKAGWGGFLSWHPGRPCQKGKTVTFTHKPGMKDGLDRINTLVFLAPDADQAKTLKGMDANVNVPLAAGAAAATPAAAAASGAAAAAGTAKKELDWATIEVPADWTPGTALSIKVTPKIDGPDGAQLGSHLHWMKKAGYGGFLSFHPGRPCKKGQTVTFNHKPEMKDELDRVDAIVFLAPGADFAKALPGKVEHFNVPLSGKAPVKTYPDRPDTVTFKKSAILSFDSPEGTIRPGESFSLTVHYKLDAADTWGDKPSQLLCMPLGPWIDNPDGVVNKNRTHIGYPGVGAQVKPVQVGEGSVTFTWKLGGAYRYNELGFLCKFKSPDGKDWPWERRGGRASFARANKTFELVTDAIGGLFDYAETPALTLTWGSSAPDDGTVAATVTVRDIEGNAVLTKTVSLDYAKEAERIEIAGLAKRGVFSATVDVPGLGSDYTFFGTIPKFKHQAGKATPFGATNVSGDDLSKLIAAMGFTQVRHFIGWGGLEPAKGVWRLDDLDKTIDSNAAAGLRPWICLYAPPSWALPNGIHGAGFEPSPFDLDAWKNAVDLLSRRYKGKLWGWEWLNEITPGSKCKDPVQEYVDICRVGTTAAKAVDPSFTFQLAGGLWPHNYRVDVLNAGVAQYVDFVPDHYSDYAGITLTRRDLEARGIQGVRTADNETASGLTTWNMDAAQTLSASVGQCLHVMTRWPDELCAGAAFVNYFGGHTQSTGNWTCFLDLHTPRPVAATLAVVQGKLAYAKPVGKFFLGDAAVHLFEADGKAIVFVRSTANGGSDVVLPARGAVTVTDYQGNETKAQGGRIHAADMPVIVEGADLDALKLHAALALGTAPVPVAVPQHVTEAADEMAVAFRVFNPYASRRTFTVTPSAPDWATTKPVEVTLAAGETKALEFTLTVKTERGSGDTPDHRSKVPGAATLSATIATKGVASVEKPYRLYAIDPSSIGNLLMNGDMEQGANGKLASWGGNAVSAEVADDPAQTGNHALRFKATGGWCHSAQNVDIPVPGQTYLYTAWVWSHGMDAGSNLGESFTDGTPSKTYFKPAVFTTPGNGNGYWQFLAKQVRSSATTKGFSFTPVANGKGDAYVDFDNVSVSLYRGSEFAAFAAKTPAASSAVPLLCENQIASEGGYAWKPANLAGIARFSYDAEALTLHVDVEDDALAATSCPDGSDGTAVLQGDALALSIFPKMGVDGPENDQLRWYISAASPGGGSGAHTLYRPADYSCGLKSGQLARDSSTYVLSIERKGTKTVYDLRIPWAELPGFTPSSGATFGCNLVLIDSDGAGKGLGRMTWGGGLRPSAGDCGLVTLLP